MKNKKSLLLFNHCCPNLATTKFFNMLSKHINLKNFTLTLSLLLLIFILTSVDWGLIAQHSQKLNTESFTAIILIFFVSIFFRSVRFSLSLPDKYHPDFLPMYYISMQHNFYLSILPARLGELSYIKLLSENLKIPKEYSIVSIISCRLYDLVVLAVFGIYSLTYVLDNEHKIIQITLSFMVVFSILVFLFLNQLIAILKKTFITLSKYTTKSLAKRISDNININNKNVANFTFQKHVKLLVTTSITWVLMSINYGVVLHMFEVKFSYPELILIVSIVNLSNLIPIQTFGGFGVKEAALISAFMAMGMILSKATALAVISRLVLYLIPLVISTLFLFVNIRSDKH